MRGGLTVDKGGVGSVGVEPNTDTVSGDIDRNAGEEEINALVTWNWNSVRDCDGGYGWGGMVGSLEREGGWVGGKVV